MRILFLVPYPTGEAPSQRFRFEQYFGLLNSENIKFNVSAFWGFRAWTILYRQGFAIEKACWLLIGFAKRCVDLAKSIQYDRIFIHRECAPVGPPVFEFVLANIFRKKIIYDFDDAIWLANTSVENSLVRWIKFHGKVKSICRWSAIVSCGNGWLADFARPYNSNVVVNPTTIDTLDLHNPERWPSKKENDRVVIGWTGTHSTIGYLLEILPALQSIEKKYTVTIRVISNKDPELPLASYEFIAWKKETEITDLIAFDIGIMPLADDEWAKGKCGFKALQYMALGIPSIASAVGANMDIIQNNSTGILCRSESEWASKLEKLIVDSAWRKSLGINARAFVAANYSVVSNSSNFLSLTKL